jgi:hypothetical protein
MGDLGTYTTRWNSAAQPMIDDYQDQSVSTEQWLASSQAQLEELRLVVTDFNERIDMVADPGLRA